MDRTAWIVVVLCVIGLVLWELYLVKQTPPRPAPVNVTPGQISPAATIASPTPPAAAEVAPKTAEPVPSFPEKIETLRNSDVELRLTNRGGGIKEAVLLKQVSENGQRVVLNSAESAPIGSLIEQPSAPALPEFSASTESDSVVRFEHTTKSCSALRERSACQALSCSPAKPTARVSKSMSARNFTIAWRNFRIMKPRSWTSGCSNWCASFS